MAKVRKQLPKKHTHSLISDFGYVFKTVISEYPAFAAIAGVWAIALPVCELAFPFIGKYSMEIITVEGTRRISIIILAALLVIKFLCECTNRICRQHMNCYSANKISWIFRKKLYIKRMTMDYQNVELTSTGDSYQKAAGSMVAISTFIDTNK